MASRVDPRGDAVREPGALLVRLDLANGHDFSVYVGQILLALLLTSGGKE